MKKIIHYQLAIIHFANRGQSIVEVVVALALIAAVVLGLVKVTITSINNAAFARDQRSATKYAQEGIENARKLKEEDEVAFWNKSGAEIATFGNFTRTITYTVIEAQKKMDVLVEVSWQDSKGTHKSSLQTYLTKPSGLMLIATTTPIPRPTPTPTPRPTCASLGGNYCSQTTNCPKGYKNLGRTSDCVRCCKR